MKLATFHAHGVLRSADLSDVLQAPLEEIQEQIRKIEDDVCDFILLNGESTKSIYDLTPEEYIEQDYKL